MNVDHVPEEHFNKLYGHRLTPEEKERVQKLFGMFIGTHKYHNYSKEVRPHQTAAMRYMLELNANDFMYINKDTFEVTDESDP